MLFSFTSLIFLSKTLFLRVTLINVIKNFFKINKFFKVKENFSLHKKSFLYICLKKKAFIMTLDVKKIMGMDERSTEYNRIIESLSDKDYCLLTFSMGFDNFLSRTNKNPNDIAKELNTTLAAVSAWKNGKNFPSFEKIVELIKLGMTFDDLFGLEITEIEGKNYEKEFERLKKLGIAKDLNIDEAKKINSKLDSILKEISSIKKAFNTPKTK